MADLDKLVPLLRHSLEVWRTRSAIDPTLADRRVTVSVTYGGDLDALRGAGLDPGHDAGGEVTGQIAFRDLEALVAVPGVTRVSMQPDARPLLNKSVVEMEVPWKVPPGFSGKGSGIIVAVIDTGIDIFHESFRKPDGTTRILELWDQSATTGGANPPAGFAQIGKVYNAAQINAGISAGPPFASVDSNGHGTRVAGIAAGNGRQDDRCSSPGTFIGVAPEADLVIVKAIALPAGSSSDTRDAMRWCAQAGTRNGNKPVVINCSYGSDLGPHDGNDYNDISVDNILRPSGGPIPAGLAVVAAAGNEGYGNTHDSGTLQPAGQPGASTTVTFVMPGNSTASDPISIWYDGAASLTVTLTAPTSTAFPGTNTTGAFAPGGSGSPFTIGGMQVNITSPTSGDPSHANRKNIYISISTTAGRRIRDGDWQITLANTAAVATDWDMRFQMNHEEGYPSFRLSSESGDPPARRRNNTIGSPGMSRNAITVANYSGNEIAFDSGRGPASYPPGTPSGEVKPTIAAIGDGVHTPRSQNDPTVPSSCCDQRVLDGRGGTSMASPHVTGLVALIFEKNRTLTFEQVRGHLQHSARVDGIPAGEAPVVIDPLPGISWSNIWGAGKVQAKFALAEIPDAPSGGGGGGPSITADDPAFGYTPHTIFSRLGEWRRRHGPRPGLMLAAALISRHVDEVLRLINHNVRVGAVWQRHGGPALVRHLLYGHQTTPTLLPVQVEGRDVANLIARLLPILDRFGGAQLKGDIADYRAFVAHWTDADLAGLDHEALRLGDRT